MCGHQSPFDAGVQAARRGVGKYITQAYDDCTKVKLSVFMQGTGSQVVENQAVTRRKGDCLFGDVRAQQIDCPTWKKGALSYLLHIPYESKRSSTGGDRLLILTM